MIEHYDGVITLELKDVTSGDTYNIVEYVSDIPRNLPMYFFSGEYAAGSARNLSPHRRRILQEDRRISKGRSEVNWDD